MAADEEQISNDSAQNLFTKAKNQNALKLVKEEYFLDKMPQSSINQIRSPTTLITSDSDSINSTCGDESQNLQTQMVEF